MKKICTGCILALVIGYWRNICLIKVKIFCNFCFTKSDNFCPAGLDQLICTDWLIDCSTIMHHHICSWLPPPSSYSVSLSENEDFPTCWTLNSCNFLSYHIVQSWPKIMRLRETMNVISSDPPCKDCSTRIINKSYMFTRNGNAKFTLVENPQL